MKPLLSILIPTLVGRERFYDSLMADLSRMKMDEVEIVTLKDNRELTIGEKRNRLLSMAGGEYCAFVDDDDKVSHSYMSAIVHAIEYSGADVIGIMGRYFENNRFKKQFVHTIECNSYTQDNWTYYRPPNHLNPIKTDIARKVQFKAISMGEDTDWAMRLNAAKLLTTEFFIGQLLYDYYYISRKFY